MKEKTKKVKSIIILFVIIAVIILFAIICIKKEPSYDKSNPITKEQAIALLKKGASYTNFYITKRTNNDKQEYERIEYLYRNGKYVIEKYKKDGTKESYWEDLNTKESIDIRNNTIRINKSNNILKSQINSIILEFIENPEYYSYTYAGETKIKNKECVVFKLQDKNANIVWSYIEKATGLELQTIYHNNTGLKRLKVDWNININTVTEAQVSKPDIEKYKGYTILSNT